jgi:hypothetical protein
VRETAAGGVVDALSGWNTTTSAEPSKGVAVNPRLFTFVVGKAVGWSMVSIKAVVGDLCRRSIGWTSSPVPSKGVGHGKERLDNFAWQANRRNKCEEDDGVNECAAS